MRKNLKLQALMLALLFLAAITSCKKDDDNGGGGDNPSQTNYRLKESVGTGDGKENTKDTYSYDNDKLSLEMNYTGSEGNWSENRKSEYSYPSDNSFEELIYMSSNGEWLPTFKNVISYGNGGWLSNIGYSYTGSDWSMSSKTVYSYTNDKITKEEAFSYISGQEQNNYKYIYSYVGDVPSTVQRYSWDWADETWQDAGMDTLYFSNGKLTKVESNITQDTIEMTMQQILEYSGDLVTKITMKYGYGGIWIDAGTINFTYDEHNNLIKFEETGDFYNFSETMTYEEGNSNLDLIRGDPGYTGFYGMGFASKSYNKINNAMKAAVLSAISHR